MTFFHSIAKLLVDGRFTSGSSFNLKTVLFLISRVSHAQYVLNEMIAESLGAIHSTKISGNFGPKLNGSVRSNRKSFEKTGPPFEVVLFSRADRLEFWLNGSRPLLISSTVQEHRIPSSSNVSALKLTLCGSAIVISVSVGSARAIKTGFRSTMPNNLFNVLAFCCYDIKWCPVSFGNSSALLRMCQLKLEFLMNYTLCPC